MANASIIPSSILPPDGASGTPHYMKMVGWQGASSEHFFDGCRHVYVDVGSNVGVQIRKLFEPSLYSDAPVQKHFQQQFGSQAERRRDTCAVGFEPNPRHAARLEALAKRYSQRGWRTTFFLGTAAGPRVGYTWLSGVGSAGPNYAALGAQVAAQRLFSTAELARRDSLSDSGVLVRVIDLAAFYSVHVMMRRAVPTRGHVVMKLDIEGAEYTLEPALLASGVLCHADFIFMEQHDVDPNSHPPVVRGATTLTARLGKQMFHARVNELMRMYPGCKTTISHLDDESYHKDPHPLPKRLGSASELGKAKGHERGGIHGSSIDEAGNGIGAADEWSHVSYAQQFETADHADKTSTMKRDAARRRIMSLVTDQSQRRFQLRGGTLFDDLAGPSVVSWTLTRTPPRWSPGRWREHVARTLQTISMHEDSVFDKLVPKSQTTNDLGEDVRLCALRYVTLEEAKSACELEPKCGGVTRDNGLPCCTIGKPPPGIPSTFLCLDGIVRDHQQPSGRGVVVRNSRKAKAAKIPNGEGSSFSSGVAPLGKATALVVFAALCCTAACLACLAQCLWDCRHDSAWSSRERAANSKKRPVPPPSVGGAQTRVQIRREHAGGSRDDLPPPLPIDAGAGRAKSTRAPRDNSGPRKKIPTAGARQV